MRMFMMSFKTETRNAIFLMLCQFLSNTESRSTTDIFIEGRIESFQVGLVCATSHWSIKYTLKRLMDPLVLFDKLYNDIHIFANIFKQKNNI